MKKKPFPMLFLNQPVLDVLPCIKKLQKEKALTVRKTEWKRVVERYHTVCKVA